MSSRRSFTSVAVLATATALAACGGSAAPSGTDDPPATATSQQPTTAAPTPPSTSTSTIPETSSPTAADTTTRVEIWLPADWGAAVVWASTDDYADGALQWETTGPTLEVILPGPGSYVFWAETPSSDDGLCFFRALTDSRWDDVIVQDGDSILLNPAGEVCE